MEFGKLDDISSVDWTLPPDDLKNPSRLLSRNQEHKLYFGSPAWGSRHWLGKIYPKKCPTDKFLHYYSRNFNSIELNTSFYRIPDEKTCGLWLSEVPDHFLFCPKVHKNISHERFGLADKTLLRPWTDFLEKLEMNLGPCFIQLHENFSYEDKLLLFKFLENWPKEFKLSLELRHPSWFQEGVILPALSDYLNRKEIGLVITDVAGRRDVLHSSVSAPWAMIRLIGNSLDPSDEKRLLAWSERLKSWGDQGLKETYLFIHQPDDILTVEFAELAQRVFQEQGFLAVPEFKREVNPTLFDFL